MKGNNMEENRKIKILVYGDSPATATGFSKVVKEIFTPLGKSGKYDIDIFGINDRGGWKDPEKYPYKIYMTMPPGTMDVYGKARFLNIIRGADLDVRPPWDIIFTLNDPFIFESPLVNNRGMMEIIKDLQKQYKEKLSPEKWFKICSYWPVDSFIKPNWLEYAIGLADYSVAYTNYGRKEIDRANRKIGNKFDMSKVEMIYHGSNTNDFYPISKEEKDAFKLKFFKSMVRPETFIVGAVARNQMRKDLWRTMKIFREFQKRRPNSFLYLHC
jgi:hypothetical protein